MRIYNRMPFTNYCTGPELWWSAFQAADELIIGVVGGPEVYAPPKCLAYLVISCFEKRCPEQNIVSRLKSNILFPPKNLASYATGINSSNATFRKGSMHFSAFHVLVFSSTMGIRKFPPPKGRQWIFLGASDQKHFSREGQPCWHFILPTQN